MNDSTLWSNNAWLSLIASSSFFPPRRPYFTKAAMWEAFLEHLCVRGLREVTFPSRAQASWGRAMQTYKHVVGDTGWGGGLIGIFRNRERSGRRRVPARRKMTGNLGMAGLARQVREWLERTEAGRGLIDYQEVAHLAGRLAFSWSL